MVGSFPDTKPTHKDTFKRAYHTHSKQQAQRLQARLELIYSSFQMKMIHTSPRI
jgi:hypothetical protein